MASKARIAKEQRVEAAARSDLWTTRNSALIAICAIVGAAIAVQTLRHGWSSQALLHLAVLDEFAHEAGTPRHPMFQLTASSASYGPWAVFWGLLIRFTGVSPVTALTVIGLTQLVLLGIALTVLVRVFSKHRSAPFWAILLLALAWGPNPTEVDGALGLASVGQWMPYPSMAALLMSFGAIAGALHWSTRPTRPIAALVVATVPTVLLIHLPTGIWLMVGLSSVAIDRRALRGPGAWLALATAGSALALFVLTVWPYFDVFDLAGVPLRSHIERRALFEAPYTFVLPSFLAVGAVLYRLRRNPTDWLALHVGGGLVLMAYGSVTDHWAWGTVGLHSAALALLAAADLIAKWTEERPWVWSAGVAAIVVAWSLPWLVQVAPSMTPFGSLDERRSEGPILDSFEPQLEFLRSELERTDVVAARGREFNQLTAASGARPLEAGFPTMTRSDPVGRRGAVQRLFDPELAPQTRYTEAARFGVTFMMVDNESAAPPGHRTISGPGGLTLVDLATEPIG